MSGGRDTSQQDALNARLALSREIKESEAIIGVRESQALLEQLDPLDALDKADQQKIADIRNSLIAQVGDVRAKERQEKIDLPALRSARSETPQSVLFPGTTR